MARNRKAKKRDKRKKNRSTLQQHRRNGGELLPPWLDKMPGMTYESWQNERLPEMIWAALLYVGCGRELALDVVRITGRQIQKAAEPSQFENATLSGLAALPEADFDYLLGPLLSEEIGRSSLRPLLLFPGLPGRDRWQSRLGKSMPDDDWATLMKAVGPALWHQAQAATDCRWVRLLFRLLAGKIKFASDMRERIVQILEYPTKGDLTEVRPFIRAAEISYPIADDASPGWAAHFWEHCRKQTECWVGEKDPEGPTAVGTTLDFVEVANRELAAHADSTATTTGIDAKHDAIFGSAGYCLCLLRELISVGNGTAVVGRLALRTIAEAFITLSWLVKQDRSDLWQQYRVYGAGQAKLAGLKLDDIEEPPRYVDAESLEALASEDIWEELLPISIGNWAKLDARKLAIQSGQKEVYDSYYSWPSAYVHATWAAVRTSALGTCGNPLHRLHRTVVGSPRQHPDVVPDAALLVDRCLSLVNACYPGLGCRVCNESA